MHRLTTALLLAPIALLAACTGGGGAGSGGPQLFSPPHTLKRTASYMLISEFCGGPAPGEGQLASWLATATGNVAPSTDIAGSNTGLISTGPGEPFLDYVDAHGITWVAAQNALVGAYPSTSTGNVPPYIQISGPNTTFTGITGVYADASGNVYVTDFSANAVDIFAAGSYSIGGSNNIAPARRIVGAATGLSVPEGIYVSATTIYVYSDGAILEWPVNTPGGNVAPSASISGANTNLGFPKGLTLDSNGNIWAAVSRPATGIEEFAAGSTGNATPARFIGGGNTNQSNPIGVAVDSQGYIYDADYGNNTVNVYGPAENGNVPPVQTISGSNTNLCQPTGVTVH